MPICSNPFSPCHYLSPFYPQKCFSTNYYLWIQLTKEWERERERESILPINKPNGMVLIQQDGKIILYESPLTKGFFSHWIGNQKNVDIRKQSYQSAESKSTHQQYHQMYLFYPFGFHFFPPLRILSWIWTEITAIWSEQ